MLPRARGEAQQTRLCGAAGKGRTVRTRHDVAASEGEALPTRQFGAAGEGRTVRTRHDAVASEGEALATRQCAAVGEGRTVRTRHDVAASEGWTRRSRSSAAKQVASKASQASPTPSRAREAFDATPSVVAAYHEGPRDVARHGRRRRERGSRRRQFTSPPAASWEGGRRYGPDLPSPPSRGRSTPPSRNSRRLERSRDSRTI